MSGSLAKLRRRFSRLDRVLRAVESYTSLLEQYGVWAMLRPLGAAFSAALGIIWSLLGQSYWPLAIVSGIGAFLLWYAIPATLKLHRQSVGLKGGLAAGKPTPPTGTGEWADETTSFVTEVGNTFIISFGERLKDKPALFLLQPSCVEDWKIENLTNLGFSVSYGKKVRAIYPLRFYCMAHSARAKTEFENIVQGRYFGNRMILRPPKQVLEEKGNFDGERVICLPVPPLSAVEIEYTVWPAGNFPRLQISNGHFNGQGVATVKVNENSQTVIKGIWGDYPPPIESLEMEVTLKILSWR